MDIFGAILQMLQNGTLDMNALTSMFSGILGGPEGSAHGFWGDVFGGNQNAHDYLDPQVMTPKDYAISDLGQIDFSRLGF